jgi:hypothetical protein
MPAATSYGKSFVLVSLAETDEYISASAVMSGVATDRPSVDGAISGTINVNSAAQDSVQIEDSIGGQIWV